MQARAQSANSTIVLDSFLTGVINCAFSKDFTRLRHSAIDRFKNEYGATRPKINASASLIVPAVFAHSIHTEQARSEIGNQGAWTTVKIPVSGTFYGLAVRQLEFVLGNENGYNAVSLVFDETRQKLASRLGLLVKKNRAALKRNAADGPSNVGFVTNRAEIFCDRST